MNLLRIGADRVLPGDGLPLQVIVYAFNLAGGGWRREPPKISLTGLCPEMIF